MKQEKYQENDNKKTRPYQVKLFTDMDVMIAEDEPVRLLDEVTDGLDYTKLYKAYAQIYLHSSRQIFSSRN